jgi:cell volume regulation protein A
MSLDAMLLFGAVVVLAAALAARLGSRLGLPSLLLFLGLGLALEVAGIKMTDASLAHSLGFIALVFILAEGGFTTRWVDIKGSLSVAGLLATVGVVVSIGLVAALCYFGLGYDLPQAVLIGAIMAPTDSAAVFSVLRGLPLPARVRSVLEGESGLNDAPVVLLVSAATAWTMGELPEGGVAGVAGLIVVELVGGIILGAVLGYLGARVLKAVALPASGLYPPLGLGRRRHGLRHRCRLTPVGVRGRLRGCGDPRQQCPAPPQRHPVVRRGHRLDLSDRLVRHARHDGSARTPHRPDGGRIPHHWHLPHFRRPPAVGVPVLGVVQGPLAGAGVHFVGGVAGGAVPIIMATVPLAAGAPSAERISEEVLVFVIVFTLVQGPSLPWVARKLGIVDDAAALDIEV